MTFCLSLFPKLVPRGIFRLMQGCLNLTFRNQVFTLQEPGYAASSIHSLNPQDLPSLHQFFQYHIGCQVNKRDSRRLYHHGFHHFAVFVSCFQKRLELKLIPDNR